MISHLLVFNTLKGPSSSNMIRHSKELETPFPRYLSLKFHGKTRAKSTINVLHDACLDVSYTRAHEVRKDIARAVCKRHSEDCIVLPTNVRQGVFSTMHFDNLDHNKLSNNDFHGSCITITNHLSHENMGQKRTPVVTDPSDDKTEIWLLAVFPPKWKLSVRMMFFARREFQPMILHQKLTEYLTPPFETQFGMIMFQNSCPAPNKKVQKIVYKVSHLCGQPIILLYLIMIISSLR